MRSSFFIRRSTGWARLLNLAAVSMVVANMVSSVHAGVIAFDDFSSGTNNGGSGWSGAWDNAMAISDASPFPDDVSTNYLAADGYYIRTFATPFLPSTTPEVWAAVYLRPTVMKSNKWQFGFELIESSADARGGAQAGTILANPGSDRQLSRTFAESPVGSGNAFTLNQPTLLVMRLYKNATSDTLYNRADLYTDLNGGDGIYNNPVTVATGLDLGNRSATSINIFRILSDGWNVDFDYVAVGTSLNDVVIQSSAPVPEPASSAIAAMLIGGSALRHWRSKRRR